jgi:hypothetical protein
MKKRELLRLTLSVIKKAAVYSFEGRIISYENGKRLQRGGLILRSPEGQEFILAEISDFNREIELTRQNKALMRLLDARGKQSKTFKASEVKKQINLD